MSGITPQRCRALNLGFDLQITNTLPRRRTTLQSRCRVFAVLRDESTFTAGLLLKSAVMDDCFLIFAFRDERIKKVLGKPEILAWAMF